ncbi:hypothetical protein CPC16_000971 [Podila verticillata]|nr:hypothetical protein CPC16_000971 [Podila verticillata]
MSSQLLTRALGSAKATLRAPLITPTSVTSQRLFHSTRLSLNEDKPTTEGEEGAVTSEESEGAPVNKKLPFRRRKFHQWLQGEGSRFATPSFSGPNYIGESPFPMNPLFKPTPPMSNHAKEEIYHLHRSDTTKWTPRQLGTKYNISIKRVEAILRLKHLEKEMVASGFVAQENFTKGMEQLMGVKNERSAAIVEPLTDILPQVGSPKFEAVNEDKTFTAEDAANVLKRRPLAEIKASLLEQERKNPFKLVDSMKGVAVKEEPVTKPVSKNSAEGNARFKFSFVDTSKKTTLIREKDGTLLQVQQS